MTRRNILTPSTEEGAPPPPAGQESDASGADGAAPIAPGGGPGGDGGDLGAIRVPPDPERDLACCRLEATPLGLAERWRVRYGDAFRLCPEIGWFAWEGKRWELLSEEKDTLPQRLIESIARTVRAIRNEADLVAASGCAPPEHFSSTAARVRYDLDSLENENAAHDRYLRGDDGERHIWLSRLDRLDFPIDILKGKYRSTALRAFARTCEADPARSVKWIKGFPSVVVRHDAFDQDRMAINVQNGTLRLVPNRVKRSPEEVAAGKSEWKVDGLKIKRFPHDRADLITKLAPVKYLPAATCPEYDQFIARVQPDAAMRRFLHQWGGLSLTGDISEHKLAFFHGGGRNGKGTWVEAMAALAGDYAGSISIDSLTNTGQKRRGDQATPDLARLPGVRFLRVSEPDKGTTWNDGLIKQLCGGDPVDARHLNKGFFTFLPSFKPTISGNNKPKSKDLSHGFWSRMQLVPWDVTIPDDEIDRKLGDKLREEGSGILNRLLEGLIDWKANGLIVPEEVRAATRAYRDDSDDVGRFLAALCEVSDDHLTVRCGAGELHKLYRAWAANAGASEIGLKSFKSAMEDKGFQSKQSDGMKWLGVQPRAGVVLEDVARGVWPEIPASSSAAVGQNYASGDDDWMPGDD